MINKNQADIQATLTGEKNSLILFPGWSIQDLSKLYTDYTSKNTGAKLSYDDFANVLGDTAVFKKYLEDSFPQGLSSYEFRFKKPEWNWDCVMLRRSVTVVT